jgi:vacuolar protein 8
VSHTILGHLPIHFLDPQLISNIRNSHMLAPHIRQLAVSRSSTPSSSVGTPHSYPTHSHSDQETETAEGQGEIQLLSRRILEFVDIDVEGMTPGATPSQSQRLVPSSVGRESVASGRETDELRKSVQNAFGSHGH